MANLMMMRMIMNLRGKMMLKGMVMICSQLKMMSYNKRETYDKIKHDKEKNKKGRAPTESFTRVNTCTKSAQSANTLMLQPLIKKDLGRPSVQTQTPHGHSRSSSRGLVSTSQGTKSLVMQTENHPRVITQDGTKQTFDIL